MKGILRLAISACIIGCASASASAQVLGASATNLNHVTCAIEQFDARAIYMIVDGHYWPHRVKAGADATVLDAIASVPGLPAVASQRRIWISRPSANGTPNGIVLPVDWKAIVQQGRTETNYQLVDGDRIHIAGEPRVGEE